MSGRTYEKAKVVVAAAEADPWKVYAQELEQWQALGWWARRKHRRPEPPK